jgi:hypothetical protein
MLNEAGRDAVTTRTSSSFALDLAKWLWISEEYRDGRAPYHATMPTDTLQHNAVLMTETRQRGFEAPARPSGTSAPGCARCWPSAPAVGRRGRVRRAERRRRAHDGSGPAHGALFREQGLQIAAGVPCSAASRSRSRRSASGSSAWTSSPTSTAPCSASPTLDRIGR